MSKPSEIWREVKPKIGEMLREINDMESKYEKAHEEAYQRGYETAKHECEDCPKQAYTDTLRMDVYQKGLSDAWEYVDRIFDMPCKRREQIFSKCDSVGVWDILREYSASEAIAKIKAWEDKQKEINVGDEVSLKSGSKGVVTMILMLGNEQSSAYVVWADGYVGSYDFGVLQKTGRHFSEMTEVMRKMGEAE